MNGSPSVAQRHTEELATKVRHLPGGTILSPAVVAEICALIAFVDSELAGPARRTSRRLQALHAALAPGCRRADATNEASAALASIQFENDVDTTTAAGLLNMKSDTLRNHLRLGHIEGRRVNGHWRIPIAAIESYNNGKAA